MYKQQENKHLESIYRSSWLVRKFAGKTGDQPGWGLQVLYRAAGVAVEEDEEVGVEVGVEEGFRTRLCDCHRAVPELLFSVVSAPS